jgi:AcrR family transcriptional regulator
MATGTREALIDAAAQLLDHGGVDAVTLREVGRRAGVSHNAPYKHFDSKEALLAAVAARELREHSTGLHSGSPGSALRAVMHDYVSWALKSPARFKLVFGAWSVESADLAAAAHSAQTALVDVVAGAQRDGELPAGDAARLASLVRSLAHGAADLAAAGHLAAEGKGGASPHQLVDDLLGYLKIVARAPDGS